MSHYNLRANVEDAAYQNLYPAAFQAKDAMWSAICLPEVVIPAKKTRTGPSILRAVPFLAVNTPLWRVPNPFDILWLRYWLHSNMGSVLMAAGCWTEQEDSAERRFNLTNKYGLTCLHAQPMSKLCLLTCSTYWTLSQYIYFTGFPTQCAWTVSQPHSHTLHDKLSVHHNP